MTDEQVRVLWQTLGNLESGVGGLQVGQGEIFGQLRELNTKVVQACVKTEETERRVTILERVRNGSQNGAISSSPLGGDPKVLMKSWLFLSGLIMGGGATGAFVLKVLEWTWTSSLIGGK